MRRVAVTGGSGFVGSALVRLLAALPIELVMLSRGQPAPVANPRAEIRWHACDLTAAAGLDGLIAGCDTVFHLAGSTARARDALGEARCKAINCMAAKRLIAAASRVARGAIVVLCGSESQHGCGNRLPLTDACPTDPQTPYDRHKTLAERALAAATRDERLRGAALRLPTIYGPGPLPAAAGRGVVSRMVRSALAGEPLEVFGDGAWRRDILYVDDAATAILEAARSDPGPGSWLVSGGEIRTIRCLAEAVARAAQRWMGRATDICHIAPPDWLDNSDRRDVVIDDSRFRRATGWAPRTTFENGLESTLQGFAVKRPMSVAAIA